MAKKEKTNPNPTHGMIKDVRVRALVVLVLLVLGLAGIYVAYIATFLTLINQILLALIFLVIAGNLIRWFGGFNGWNALYLMATKNGLWIIDRIAEKRENFWESLSIWGVVISLGLLSYPFLKGKIDKRLFVFGIISLYFFLAVVLNYTLTGVQFINLPQIQNLVGGASPTPIFVPPNLEIWIVYIITMIAGFTGYIITYLGLILLIVTEHLVAFSITVASGTPQTSTLSNVVPGVVPVIPGITIPLFAGITALVILLAIHETSHGILARIAKVKLKSWGLLLVGVIPLGAFVEPDEKQVEKLDSIKQTRIFAAGSSINYLAAAVFFVLVFLFLTYLVPGFYLNTVLVNYVAPGYPAANIIKPGMQILEWNGYPIHNLSSFDIADANVVPNSIVTVVTNNGTYAIKTVAGSPPTHGIIGIDAYQPLKTTFTTNVGEFTYTVLALSLAFNLFVAMLNMLPFTIFDGSKVYSANIKNKRITKAMSYLIIVLLLAAVFATILSIAF